MSIYLDLADKCRHECVNALQASLLCNRKVKSSLCDSVVKRIVMALDLQIEEIKALEIEERR